MPEEKKIKRREYKKNWRDNLSKEQKLKAKNRYRCLPEEDKNKIRECARNRYHTLKRVVYIGKGWGTFSIFHICKAASCS